MPAALSAIFQSHRRSLLFTVMRIVRDHQTAEDLAQETYIRARAAFANGRIEHIEAFLYQTARNLALDHTRRNRMRAKFERKDATDTELSNVAANTPSQEAVIIQRERLRVLEKSLEKLPERARQVWHFNRIEKWTYPQIAEHLSVSINTVFNDLKMAIAVCQEAIERHDRD